MGNQFAFFVCICSPAINGKHAPDKNAGSNFAGNVLLRKTQFVHEPDLSCFAKANLFPAGSIGESLHFLQLPTDQIGTTFNDALLFSATHGIIGVFLKEIEKRRKKEKRGKGNPLEGERTGGRNNDRMQLRREWSSGHQNQLV